MRPNSFTPHLTLDPAWCDAEKDAADFEHAAHALGVVCWRERYGGILYLCFHSHSDRDAVKGKLDELEMQIPPEPGTGLPQD